MTSHFRLRGHAPTHRRDRRGFSLVELVVATMILTVGVLGLAGTASVVVRQMTVGARQTQLSTLAQSRFERMRGLPCAAITGGTATTDGIREAWAVAPLPRGTGMRMADTLSYDGPTGTRRVVYRSVITCR